MTLASLRYLDRKQKQHGERGKDDERVDDVFHPVWHDGSPEHQAVMFESIASSCTQTDGTIHEEKPWNQLETHRLLIGH